MKKILWKKWFILLSICVGIAGGYHLIEQRIPSVMHLYEEDVKEVLSGTGKRIEPGKLSLDFPGDVQVSKSSDGYTAVCHLFGMIPVKPMNLQVITRLELIPGGIPVGIYVQTDGIFVIGTGQIETPDGMLESPGKNIIKTGDYIVSFQGTPIERKQQLIDRLKAFQEKELVLGIRRNQELIEVVVEPVFLEDGAHIGVWVRDDTQGVGTLTYLTADGKFAALGHGISDTDSELLMEVSKGKLYDCEIFAITKGEKGKTGKLSGKIVYNKKNLYGDVEGNLNGGIYGSANSHLLSTVQNRALPSALKQEIKEGDAVILSSVGGSVEEYQVQITRIFRGEKDINKGMEILVTDDRLLSLTGGIVQGMSGSPIIQDGKFIGAVTHVFVNDPQKGYGIFIEDMLEKDT